MTTPGGLIRKQVYLSPSEVAILRREVERRRARGEEATESGVFREMLGEVVLAAARQFADEEFARQCRGEATGPVLGIMNS